METGNEEMKTGFVFMTKQLSSSGKKIQILSKYQTINLIS